MIKLGASLPSGAGLTIGESKGSVATPGAEPCAACSGLGFVLTQSDERAVARVCECRANCARCRGERFVLAEEGGYTVAVPCDCARLATNVQLYNDTGIPGGYARKHLSGGTHNAAMARQRGLKLDYDAFQDRENPSLRHALARVRDYERTFTDSERRGLVLIGGFGLGKTHLVCALLARLTLRHGVSCRFADYHELTSRIRSTFDGNSEETESAIIEPLIKTQILVIDDIGKAQASAWALSVLDQIVTRRYNARRIIFATTNYALEGDKRDLEPNARRRRDLSESLEERIGERLVSRLRATCDFLTLEGSDYRVDGPRGAR